MSQNNISTITLNSVRDNKKFEINAVKLLYSLPEKSFTLINDEQNNIYLAKVKKFEKVSFTDDNYNDNLGKQNSNARQSILRSYDIFLNDKYEFTLNQKTIQRVKNFLSMIINRSFKDFKFRHRSKKSNNLYFKKVKNDDEVLNLIDNFLNEKNSLYLSL